MGENHRVVAGGCYGFIERERESYQREEIRYLMKPLPPVCNDGATQMIDDQDLGFLTNFLGIFIFALLIAYHYVTADPKYEGN
ncbi:hypothetical protein HHK36_016433 [Tetracentron sinense]|uniref:Oligosaccaryltransferase n=1 Tax=Tetracentron sinense TaxID=13715 RepID=A0A835DBY1_TETSI|nr:hypothetical protein HHK36_016433 [Tetracentron sinense]